ncbi:MAG: hypothetical protein HFJ81_00395 [Clostridia bacterium]|nr:hypothetical protein [Clostridia bacterium]
MGEEKRNKVVAAITINAILLIFIIIAVLIAQIVQISVLRRRKNALINECNTLVNERDKLEDFIDKYEKDEAIRQLILEMKKLGMTDKEILDRLKSDSKASILVYDNCDY